MIIFHKIKYKNFLSSGNKFIKIDLDKNPTTAVSGVNGVGKCLHPDTEIEIEFKSKVVENVFKKFVTSNVTIKHVSDFYDLYPEFIGELQVNTRFGYKTIEYASITAYDSLSITLKTENNKVISTSPDHLLFSNDKWIQTKLICVNDYILTKNGYEKIIEIVKIM